VIEVHISNTFTREKYRKKSYLSPVCIGIITGFGLKSYEMAITYFTL
jgi:3-dehydroquinate dehydratase-2